MMIYDSSSHYYTEFDCSITVTHPGCTTDESVLPATKERKKMSSLEYIENPRYKEKILVHFCGRTFGSFRTICQNTLHCWKSVQQ